ncbi:hypothetical protein AHF37_04289 [Paragonimus kellicotti]|nr:hypothetical protein AHF37_04289 [Paragonimus kellicotti]
MLLFYSHSSLYISNSELLLTTSDTEGVCDQIEQYDDLPILACCLEDTGFVQPESTGNPGVSYHILRIHPIECEAKGGRIFAH